MKCIAVILITIMHSTAVSAACYEVGNLSGSSALQFENYGLSSDGYGNQRFQIVIDGTNSAVMPSDLPCTQNTPNSVICLASNVTGGNSTIEIWTVDHNERKVVYTQHRSGWGSLDGSKLLHW